MPSRKPHIIFPAFNAGLRWKVFCKTMTADCRSDRALSTEGSTQYTAVSNAYKWRLPFFSYRQTIVYINSKKYRWLGRAWHLDKFASGKPVAFKVTGPNICLNVVHITSSFSVASFLPRSQQINEMFHVYMRTVFQIVTHIRLKVLFVISFLRAHEYPCNHE